MDLTFADLRIRNMTEAEKSIYRLDDIAYIEELSRSTGVDITSATVASLLAGVEAGNRREINAKFFALPQPSVKELTEWENSLLINSEKAFKMARVKEYRAKLEQSRHYAIEAENKYRHYTDNMASAFAYRQEGDALLGKNAGKVITEIREVLKSGFWELLSMPEQEKLGILAFATCAPITMNLPGEKKSVLLGKFKATLNLVTGLVVLQQQENNLNFGGYYHPYVSKSGKICWGNAEATARKFQIDGSYQRLFSLLASLLTTYSVNSHPYVQLGHLALARKAQETGQKLCDDCVQLEEDCECTTSCVGCGVDTEDSRLCDECCSRHEGPYSDCDCCSYCDSSGEDCERCSDCSEHDCDGHEETQEERPTNET